MKKMNKKGFTLVEIMIVVAIIGLLAAIGIPSIVGAYSKAQEKSMARNITDVEKAKAMMTLPTEVSKFSFATKTDGDAVSEDELKEALKIDALSDLNVGDQVLTINAIGTKATYGAAP